MADVDGITEALIERGRAACPEVSVSLQALAANAAEQPWFDGARDLFATPARALPLAAGVAGVYAAALLGLRRLLAEPATDAGW